MENFEDGDKLNNDCCSRYIRKFGLFWPLARDMTNSKVHCASHSSSPPALLHIEGWNDAFLETNSPA